MIKVVVFIGFDFLWLQGWGWRFRTTVWGVSGGFGEVWWRCVGEVCEHPMEVVVRGPDQGEVVLEGDMVLSKEQELVLEWATVP